MTSELNQETDLAVHSEGDRVTLFQNWIVPEKNGHLSRKEGGKVTCGFNFSF